MSASPGLIADFGGTFVRFALAAGGKSGSIRRYACRDFDGPVAAAKAYLAEARPDAAPERAAFDIAGPVSGERGVMTNLAWSFDAPQLARALGLRSLALVNDFSAVAHAVLALGPGDTETWSAGKPPAAPAPIAVVGPGTGLGISGLVPDGHGGWRVLAGEGGHATFAPRSDDERRVADALAAVLGHVSYERVVSGMGLSHAHAALSGKTGGSIVEDCTPAEEVAEQARAGDETALRAAAVVAGGLGTVAADVVLTLGAWGGLYLAGGLIGHLGPAFDRRAFLRRFADKGRFSDDLAAVAVRLVTADDPALIGLAALLAAQDG